jgi:hypothetical protein
MIKKILPLFILCFVAFKPQELPFLSWATMQNVEFEPKYVAETKMDMLFPVFTSEIKKLKGQIVEVEGYVIPFDKSGAKVALSATNYASCFFCGKAGPASIMSINLKVGNPKYKTDQFRRFKGKLKLNDSDIREFYYALDLAEEVK